MSFTLKKTIDANKPTACIMTGKAIPCFSNKVFHIFLFERKASKSSTQNRHLCRWDRIDNRQGNGKKKSPLKGHTRKSTLKDEPENVEKTAHSEKRGQKGKYQNLKRRILRTVSLRSLQIMEQSIDEQVLAIKDCLESGKLSRALKTLFEGTC